MPDALRDSLVPKLRFPEFESEWKPGTIRQYVQRVIEPVDVEPGKRYRQIGIRSHGKGLFHKDEVFGSELGEKRVFWVRPNTLVINIVFAWEQALALTTQNEKEMIASHRFPMFAPIDGKSDLNFMLHFFMRKQGKDLLALASPGGAGRNKTLGQSEFMKLKVIWPSADEQKKIAIFLTSTDSKLETLRRKRAALERYRKGLMQQLFSQERRFARDDGTAFPAWERKSLGSYLVPYSERVPAETDIPVYSSSREGLRAQKAYFADREVANEGEYGVVPRNYMTYRHMSDDLTFIFNINDVADKIAVSKEYPVFTANGLDLRFLKYLLNNSKDFKRFAAKQKLGGTRTRLYFRVLCEFSSSFPCIDEQRKIADALVAIDAKVDAVSSQISSMEAFKRGVSQQMFV